MEGEVLRVQPVRAVVVLLHDLPDLVDVLGHTVRGHSHDLVLALVDFKTQERRERAVEQANRVREVHLPGELQVVALADAHGCGGPLADTVERQDRGLVKGRAEVGAGGVGEMVLREQYLLGIDADGTRDQALNPQLVKEPGPHALHEHPIRLGKPLQGRLQEPVKLDEGLFEEHNVVYVRAGNAGLVHAELYRVLRIIVVVFDSSESFFFGCRHQNTVFQQSGGGIVKIAGYS